MKNFEFWCTKKCPGKEFILEITYEFIENHECIYEFMKKHLISGVPKSGQRTLIYEFIFEFIFTDVNSYMKSYMNMIMNSYI